MSTIRSILEAKGRDIHTIQPGATILEAVDAMCKVHIGALLVLEGNVVSGIISERDVMCRVILERQEPARTTVADAMTRNVVCIDIDKSVEEAMAIMTERRCRHLPVVVDGKVQGIVSIGDLVRWASRDQEFEIRILHEYVEGRYPG
jgi:CBS domain-containing protein